MDFSLESGKGVSISLQYVMLAVAGIVAVALLISASNSWIETLAADFAGSVSYPQS